MIPNHISIFHASESYDVSAFSHVDKYFRIIHHLKSIPKHNLRVQNIDIDKDKLKLVSHINVCYRNQNISISSDSIDDWMLRDVYDKSLWVKIVIDKKIIASGIAEYDSITHEGILEWIQVDPSYQRKGYGSLIVNELLYRLSSLADFVTVSGKLDSIYNPIALYRACGFIGDDIWYVCHA